MSGKLIVLDGTDGSGKATQTKILVEKLKQEGYTPEIADFPQYGKKSAAMVEEYLNGKYGGPNDVSPYIASTFYAIDRYDLGFQIRKWLEQDKIVIGNRYVAANMGHQGSKFANSQERKKYFDWLYHLEYEIFKIPKPDLNIILHVPAAISQKLVDQKEAREYIGDKKRDIHENDLNHLKAAEQSYLEATQTYPDFTVIECTKNSEMLSREEIAEMIWQEVSKII